MDYDPEPDLKILEAMASALKTYLHGKDLYGMISHAMPRMTVGGLLLRLYRLDGLEEALDGRQQKRLQAARQHLEEMREQWQLHYEEKVLQEFHARLRSLNNFVDESEGRGKQNPVEITNRTIAEHLQAEAQRLNCWTGELAGMLRQTDHRLRAVLGSGKGEFHWEKELKSLYPPEKFWWLYN